MPDVKNEKVVRGLLPMIYVLDASGSMEGERIAAVNEAMSETMEIVSDISAHNADAEIKIGVLKFASGATWVTNGLEDLEDFIWADIEAGGTTELGAALYELHNKLSRSAYLTSSTGHCVPVIIFMSDGQPTDEWEKALDFVKVNNKWFSHATKIGIAVGDDADKNVLAKVVGSSEAVISVRDLETLKKLIKVVSATSSLVNSKSRTSAQASTAGEIIKTTMDELGGEGEGAVTAPDPVLPDFIDPGDQQNQPEVAWSEDDGSDSDWS